MKGSLSVRTEEETLDLMHLRAALILRPQLAIHDNLDVPRCITIHDISKRDLGVVAHPLQPALNQHKRMKPINTQGTDVLHHTVG